VSGPPPAESELSQFPPGTERWIVAGVGHFMPRERPATVVEAFQALLG